MILPRLTLTQCALLNGAIQDFYGTNCLATGPNAISRLMKYQNFSSSMI